MNKKISQFTEVINLTDNAYIPIIQGTPLDDYIISKGNLFNEISSGGASKDYVDEQDAILNAKIDTEIQNRINDDLTLNNDLSFEISERISADNNLEEIIVQETEDRITADLTKVPYVGATQDVNLNNHSINNVNSIGLNNSETIYWDVDENSLSYTLPDGGNIAIGKEIFDYYTNIDSVNLVNGDIVSIFPISGNRKGIKRTDATNSSSVKNIVGMVTVPLIAPNNIGRVTKMGEVHELITDAYNEGTQIYVDPSNPGKWIGTEPDAPNYAVLIGNIVVKHQTVGIVNLQLKYSCKLEDIANVNGTEPINGSFLTYNSSTGVHDFTSKVSDFATNGHNHDDRYYTETETITLLSGKSDTSHSHTGVYSSLSMNVLSAGVGDTEYTLLRNVQTNILNTLPSGVNSTITLPVSVAGELNECVLHFSTGAILPTLVYNGFTPVWQGGNTLTLAINKSYTIVFEQVRTSTSTWIVKTSWGEY